LGRVKPVTLNAKKSGNKKSASCDALEGLGEDTKLGAAGLVMAILGGAIIPLFQAALIDSAGVVISYIVPAVCFLVVAGYGYFDMRAKRGCVETKSRVDAKALKEMDMGIAK